MHAYIECLYGWLPGVGGGEGLLQAAHALGCTADGQEAAVMRGMQLRTVEDGSHTHRLAWVGHGWAHSGCIV